MQFLLVASEFSCLGIDAVSDALLFIECWGLYFLEVNNCYFGALVLLCWHRKIFGLPIFFKSNLGFQVEIFMQKNFGNGSNKETYIVSAPFPKQHPESQKKSKQIFHRRIAARKKQRHSFHIQMVFRNRKHIISIVEDDHVI